MTIVINLDVMMAKRKRRLKEVAKAVGITESNLSLIKTNTAHGMRFKTLNALCAYLDCQPGDLLEYVEDKKRSPAKR